MTANAETTTGPRYVPFHLFDVPLSDLTPGSAEYALAWLHQARKVDWAATHEVRDKAGKVIIPADSKAEACLGELWDLADTHGVRTALGLHEAVEDDCDDALFDEVWGVDPWLPPPRDVAWDAKMDLLGRGGLHFLGKYALVAHAGEVQAALAAFEAEYPAQGAALRGELLAWKEEAKQPMVEQVDRGGFDLSSLAGHVVGEIPWTIKDTAAPGAMLLVGRPKGGKSLVTADMVFAVANGKPFYGRETKRSEVLWIAAEDDKDQLTRRLRKRGEAFPSGVTVFTEEWIREERKNWEDGCTLAEWLRTWLSENPDVKLVIVDTHGTAEARWQGDDTMERGQSAVTHAYKKAREYQDLGLALGVTVVLVHHTRKRNGKEVTDYHELINMPMTIVAGVTSSCVLADVPEANPHEPSNQRVWAVRGRHMTDRAEMLEMGENLSFTLKGNYFEIRQTETQAEIMECVEAILEECEQTTAAEVAEALGKNRSTIKTNLRTMQKDPAKLKWKGRVLHIKQGKGGGLCWRK